MKSDSVSRLQHSLLLAAILLFGAQLATEITALKLNFQSGLGKPLVAWLHLYNPFDFFLWTINYWNVPRVHPYLMPGLYVFLSALTLVVILAIRHNIRESQQKEVVTTHGSARFATLAEIEDSGLLNNSDPLAVYIGGLQQANNKIHYLRDSSPTHVFAYAPSRSGKGVGLIVPTLLMYQGSVIVSDFKLENWQLTAGIRQAMGHTALKFDPTCADDSAAGFNPLMEIRIGDFEVRDTQLVADMIIDQGGDTKKKNSHWDNAANSLLVSVILHVLYAEPDKSLAGVRNFLSNVARSEQETLYHMLKTIHDPDKKYHWHDPATNQLTLTHPVIAFGAREMLNKSESERTGIFSTALTVLKLYRDPLIAKNTRSHDFTIDALVNHEKPVSLYLGIPPSDIERTMPLMRLVLQQILARLTEQLIAENGMAKRRQLLLMLDEFPQFGRLPFFEKALGYAAGYNIRAYLISQDIQQIYKEYGKEQSIISNCGVRIAFTPNTLETAKQLSEVIGITTIKNTRWSYGSQGFRPLMDRATMMQDDIKRPLMTADELLRMDKNKALVFLNGLNPIEGHKIYYYCDPFFENRAKIKPPEQSDRLIVELPWIYTKPINDESLLPDNAEPTINTMTENKIPAVTTRKPTPAISIPVLKELFLNSVRKKYLENQLTINQRDSWLHSVADGLLIVASLAVDAFVQVTPDLINQAVSNTSASDALITRLAKPSGFGKLRCYYWGDWENREIFEGFLVNPKQIISGELPSINYQLHIDITDK